jgi:hypothetical protein
MAHDVHARGEKIMEDFGRKSKKFEKRRKAKIERKRARRQPNCEPFYNRYALNVIDYW